MYIRVNIKVKLTNSFGLFSILWYIEIRSRPKRYYCMIKKWLFATKVYSKSSLAEKKNSELKFTKGATGHQDIQIWLSVFFFVELFEPEFREPLT